MNKLLENYKLPNLIQEEVNYLTSPMTIKEIEFVIIFPTKKFQAQMTLL